MKIVALDFETANNSMASACSLGISVFCDGELTDSFEWLIKPHHRYRFFTNSAIHGITLSDVENEEEFFFYYEKLSEILKESYIVAHNAPFDICVLNSVCDVYGLDHFTNCILDTVAISRRVYPELYNHKLNTVCEYLGIELDHHHACSDALACLQILLMAMNKYETEDIEDFMKRISLSIKKNR